MSVGKINEKLKNIKYTVKVYDARRLVDYIKVSIKTTSIFCEVEFPIEIRIRPLPILSFRQFQASKFFKSILQLPGARSEN